MDLVGKTIAREEDFGYTLIFTDGTGLRFGNDEYYTLDYAGVQAFNHKEQGHREAARMRALHKTLHPRDQQWLAQQKRVASERRLAAAGPFERAWKHEFAETLIAAQKDMNRMTFQTIMARQPRLKKKHRPYRELHFPPGNEFTIPIKRGHR